MGWSDVEDGQCLQTPFLKEGQNSAKYFKQVSHLALKRQK